VRVALRVHYACTENADVALWLPIGEEAIDDARSFGSGISRNQACKSGIEWDLCAPVNSAIDSADLI
jgi:hypothetical protein